LGSVGILAAVAACGSDDAGGGKAPGGVGASGSGSSSGSGGASGSGGTVATGGTSATGGGSGSGGAAGTASGACPLGIQSDTDVGQALPQSTVDTTYVVPTGKSVKVAAGGDLQAAIDAASPGDEIRLAPGATFKGPFTLPKKTGDAVIVIRSDVADGELPAQGQRIDPSYASKLARVVVPANVGSVIGTAPGAHHYRLLGLEVSPEPGAYVTNLIDLGSGAKSDAELPHQIVIDRCYVHGDPAKGARRGVALNSKAAAVVDSWFADLKEAGADSQAIAGWAGPGPFQIVNNHLEGAGENIMFGGADPKIANLVPSDITICGNHIVKPVAWKPQAFSEKNLFELKNARRVLVAGNVLENNWADAQVGFAVVLTPRNQDGSAPWSTVEDLTFVYNIVRHTASGINLAGEDNNHPSQQQQRIVIQNNLFDDVNRDVWGGDGRVFQLIAPAKPSLKVKIDHNTATTAGNAFLVMGDSVVVSLGARFTNNIVIKGDYGAFGSGKGEGTGALSFFMPDAVFANNAIVGALAGSYPTGNHFPATVAAVGFKDAAAGDYSLLASSSYKGKGSDGKDLGADMAGLTAAIAGVVK
jgi:hypothetical protein